MEYNELIANKNKRLRYIKKNYYWNNNIYNLNGIISAAFNNHFICFIYNYHSSINKFNLIKVNTYLIDGCNNYVILFN